MNSSEALSSVEKPSSLNAFILQRLAHPPYMHWWPALFKSAKTQVKHYRVQVNQDSVLALRTLT